MFTVAENSSRATRIIFGELFSPSSCLLPVSALHASQFRVTIDKERYAWLQNKGKRAMSTCQSCGKEIEQKPGGHPRRRYCNDACKQKRYRLARGDESERSFSERLEKELAEIRAVVLVQEREIQEATAAIADQADTIEEQSQEITRLRSLLDIEKRALDITPRYFKSWLKKQPSSPFVSKMFADPNFPARGPRSLYEARVRYLHCSDEEHEDFVRLWKLLLLEQP